MAAKLYGILTAEVISKERRSYHKVLLSDEEKRILDGEYGTGTQKAMSFLKTLGESSGVEADWEYINNRRAQIL